jgi:hypothetical protein
MLRHRIVKNVLSAAVCAVILCFFVVSTAAAMSQIIVVNNDGPNEGFNDSTPVSALPGNPATTLGAQRLAAFTAAAQVWEAALDSTVPIRVQANMDPQACSPTSGILGAAGPQTVFRDFTNAPVANTWYSVALANSLAGSDLDPAGDDIGATFNSDVDDDPNCLTGNTWWYGINAPAPSGTISFYDTILHEIGHGINFLTFVNSTTGEKLLGHDDIYMTFLEDGSQGMAWRDMTNGQRAASAIDTGDLRWTGALANACGQAILNTGLSDGHVRMYAPNPFQQGSSVSHWDTALFPDELMEPSATPTSDQRVTEALLRDMGWSLSSPSCVDGGGGDGGGGIEATKIPISPPLTKGSISETVKENLFEFTVTTEGPYIIETEGKTPSVDTVMFLFGPDSHTTLIQENDDMSPGKFSSRIVATLTPGAYYVKVKLYQDDQVGEYTIFVRAE